MRFRVLSCAVFVCVAAEAWADEPWEAWQTEWKGEAHLVAAPGFDGPFGRDGEDFVFGGRVQFDTDRVLDSGLEIGGRVSFDVQRDHPFRPGFAGAVPVAAGFPVRRGAFSGLAGGGPDDETETRVNAETAFVYVKGGYGEVRAGRDRGVAARFQEGAPSVFSWARLDSPRLDASGGSFVRTDHDLTGPSVKLSATSPRIVGVRAGVSFTPETEGRGLDRWVRGGAQGADRIEIENAVEAALNVSRRLRESGVRLQAGVAASRGDVNGDPGLPGRYGSVETYSIGASAEFETITIGASALHSDNGISEANGDYSAWSAGMTKTWSDFTFGASYGEAEDRQAGLDAQSWTLGVARPIGDHVTAALGYRSESAEIDGPAIPLNTNNDRTSRGIVVEITLSL